MNGRIVQCNHWRSCRFVHSCFWYSVHPHIVFHGLNTSHDRSCPDMSDSYGVQHKIRHVHYTFRCSTTRNHILSNSSISMEVHPTKISSEYLSFWIWILNSCLTKSESSELINWSKNFCISKNQDLTVFVSFSGFFTILWMILE